MCQSSFGLLFTDCQSACSMRMLRTCRTLACRWPKQWPPTRRLIDAHGGEQPNHFLFSHPRSMRVCWCFWWISAHCVYWENERHSHLLSHFACQASSDGVNSKWLNLANCHRHTHNQIEMTETRKWMCHVFSFSIIRWISSDGFVRSQGALAPKIKQKKCCFATSTRMVYFNWLKVSVSRFRVPAGFSFVGCRLWCDAGVTRFAPCEFVYRVRSDAVPNELWTNRGDARRRNATFWLFFSFGRTRD